MAVAAFIALLVAFAWTKVHYGYGFKGAVACVATTGRHATRYATGYSESAFQQIRAGMTQKQVLARLGQPLERITYASAPGVEWRYSQAATRSGHFHIRSVRFTRDGKVVVIVKAFHFS